jgi:hypothetical protein
MATATRTSIERLEVTARTIPTDAPESDGTLEWDSTTIVVVLVRGGGAVGLGYTYTDAAAGQLIEGRLAEAIRDGMPSTSREPGTRCRRRSATSGVRGWGSWRSRRWTSPSGI